MKKILLLLVIFTITVDLWSQNKSSQPVRIAVVGLSHDHVHWILGRKKTDDVEVVAIVENNRELAERYSKRYNYPMNIVYPTLDAMYAAIKPEAVVTFTSIYNHLKVVEFCAPRKIHVMVEKPLAVNVEHAKKMIGLAKKHNIHLMTNYETTWYGSNEKAYELVSNKDIGDIKKITFHTGHQGPVEIGCSKEFLSWLTDPILNGGGAIIDFGCYGANLATWLMKGEKPVSVFAVTNTNKPLVYPKVDDEATIILQYKKAQVVIQPSWNWPYSRKDMQVYGTKGFVFCNDAVNMSYSTDNNKTAATIKAHGLPQKRNDPFTYFANLVRGNIQQDKFDLSGTTNNEMVVKILQAAKQSAKTGRKITWSDYYSE